MAVKRVPTGMTWEQHLKIGMDFGQLSELIIQYIEERKGGRHIDRLSNLLIKLKHEMDEFISLDCKGKPRVDLCNVYYGPDRPDIAAFTFHDARSNLKNLRDLLEKNNARGSAVKHINAMLDCMARAGL